jgi:hypothetical protein
VNRGSDWRWVEFFAGVDREARHRRRGWNPVEADKFNFVDYGMSGEAGGSERIIRNQRIGLRTRERGSGDEQPENRHN